ncbi:VOC family protein [Amycolatopsis sp. NPDC049688]|uniref:VOC family protein n=1 Tax=Amycolatopsis sp. NPDC049688 TaxID=3154733 RepID=UPI00344ABC52
MEILKSRVLIRPRDAAASTAFYRDTLGLAVEREFPGGTVFFLGHGSLEVSGTGETGASPDLVLWLQVRDLAGTLADLKTKGLEPVRDARREPWGLDEAWIADPDGTRIVLVEVPEGHPIRTDTR